MWTIEEFKRDRDKQIMVFCIAFFLLSFPLYFNVIAKNVDESGMGGVGMYAISGEISMIELDSGMEYVSSGDTWTIDDLHTDAINGADDMNIIGVLVTLSYDEDETGSGGPACAQTGAENAPDTITGMVMHGQNNASASGTNDDAPASHIVESLWYNDSMNGAIVFMSESEIIEQIDAKGAGLGAYSVEITVDAQEGNPGGIGGVPPNCDREDNGEEVSYKVELIVWDYIIIPFIDPEEL